MNLVINGILAVSMTISGFYLAIRATKLRNTAIALLSLALLSFLVTTIAVELLTSENILARSLVVANYSIIIVLFTKYAFYKNKKSPFKLVLILSLAIRVVNIIEMNIFRYVVPSPIAILPEQLPTYYFHMTVLAIQLAIAFGWLSLAAFREYAAVKTEAVDPWVRKRYLVIGISHTFFAILSIVYYLIPTDGLGYASPDAIAANLFIPPFVVSYAVFSLLAWVMPDWFKRVLNAGKPVTSTSDIPEVFKDVPKEIKDRVIVAPELMKVIDFLGDKLSAMIKKPPGAAKGLFLMAIDRELGEVGLYAISLSNLLKVTNNSLKEILKAMGIENTDAVIAELASDIIKNQSVLLMMAV